MISESLMILFAGGVFGIEARRREFLGLQGLPRLFQALASDATNDDLQLYGLLALVALAGEGGTSTPSPPPLASE